MTDQKLENMLNLALDATEAEREKSLQLNVGYDPLEKQWEVIVKYSGDLREVLGDEIPIVELLNGFAILTVPQSLIERLTDYPQIEFIEKPKRLFFAVNQGKSASCMTSVQSQFSPLGMPLTGKGILVACVDSGIDYSHPDFRNQDGTTRILRLWDQSISGNPPKGYVIGTEYTSEQINTALAAETKAERERIVPSRDLSGHGTGVMGIAAGNGRASDGVYRGVAYESDLNHNYDLKTGRLRSHNYNGEYAFRVGLTWTSLSISNISVRYSPTGFLFDSKGAMGFCDNRKDLMRAIALLNSKVGSEYLKIFSPTVDFKVGDVIQIPDYAQKDEIISELVEKCIELSKGEWDS